MADRFASGSWHVTQGKEEEFVERWTDFLRWTRKTQPALVTAGLIRDERDPRHFISFAEWEHPEARDAWKANREFGEQLAACRALCDTFRGSDYERVVTI